MPAEDTRQRLSLVRQALAHPGAYTPRDADCDEPLPAFVGHLGRVSAAESPPGRRMTGPLLHAATSVTTSAVICGVVRAHRYSYADENQLQQGLAAV